MRKYLLSIIIPTKNRPETALQSSLIAAQVGIDHKVEVVIQDCSDDNSLQLLLEHSDLLGRVNYEHTAPVSMIQNWNRAVERANGEYLLIIGDDDAVYPTAINVAEWAHQNSIKAIKQQYYDQYWWEGFFDKQLENKLRYKTDHTCSYKVVTVAPLLKRHANTGDHYSAFPMAYHNIIHYGILDNLKNKTGNYFFSLSPDVYSGYAIACMINDFVVLDMPITIVGSSPKSNSQRSKIGLSGQHFNEFKAYKFSSLAPETHALCGANADSMIAAFENMNRNDLIESIDFSRIYARTVVEEQSRWLDHLRRYGSVRKQLKRSALPWYVSFVFKVFGKAMSLTWYSVKTQQKKNNGFKFTECPSISEAVKFKMKASGRFVNFSSSVYEVPS